MTVTAMPIPKRCAECGSLEYTDRPIDCIRWYREECPTDLGTEVREGWEWLCNECANEIEATA